MQGAVPINGSMSDGEYNEVESNKDELKRIIETLTSSKNDWIVVVFGLSSRYNLRKRK